MVVHAGDDEWEGGDQIAKDDGRGGGESRRSRRARIDSRRRVQAIATDQRVE